MSRELWLSFFLALWAIILLLVLLFIVVDYKNAFDRDPETPTFSEFIKKWRRQRWYRTPLVLSACSFLVLPPVWLFFHLGLELA